MAEGGYCSLCRNNNCVGCGTGSKMSNRMSGAGNTSQAASMPFVAANSYEHTPFVNQSQAVNFNWNYPYPYPVNSGHVYSCNVHLQNGREPQVHGFFRHGSFLPLQENFSTPLYQASVPFSPPAIPMIANVSVGLGGPNISVGLNGPNVSVGLAGPNVSVGVNGPNISVGLHRPNGCPLVPSVSLRPTRIGMGRARSSYSNIPPGYPNVTSAGPASIQPTEAMWSQSVFGGRRIPHTHYPHFPPNSHEIHERLRVLTAETEMQYILQGRNFKTNRIRSAVNESSVHQNDIEGADENPDSNVGQLSQPPNGRASSLRGRNFSSRTSREGSHGLPNEGMQAQPYSSDSNYETRNASHNNGRYRNQSMPERNTSFERQNLNERPNASFEGQSFNGRPNTSFEGQSFNGRPNTSFEGQSFNGRPNTSFEGQSFNGGPNRNFQINSIPRMSRRNTFANQSGNLGLERPSDEYFLQFEDNEQGINYHHSQFSGSPENILQLNQASGGEGNSRFARGQNIRNNVFADEGYPNASNYALRGSNESDSRACATGYRRWENGSGGCATGGRRWESDSGAGATGGRRWESDSGACATGGRRWESEDDIFMNSACGFSIPQEHLLCPNVEKYGYGGCLVLYCPFRHTISCNICHAEMTNKDDAQVAAHRKHCALEKIKGDLEKKRVEELGTNNNYEKSKDKSCGICFDTVIEKTDGDRRFGILSNCCHCFCLGCIRSWRKARVVDELSELENVRCCPECRIFSDFICPSAFWVETKEEKDKLIDNYKEALGRKPCKYFRRGRGKCPFGNRCFYQHANMNGEIVDVGPPRQRRRRRRQRRQDSDFDHMFLWGRFLMYDAEDEPLFDDIIALFSETDDSDWSDLD